MQDSNFNDSNFDNPLLIGRRNNTSVWGWFSGLVKSYYPLYYYGKVRSTLQARINRHFSGSEIIKGLWVSDIASTCDLQALEDRNITYIVCAVLGVLPQFPKDIEYAHVPLRDTEDENIIQYFDGILPIIHEKLQKGNSGVLVHCMCGVSRSVTIIAAYLIRYENKTTEEAIHAIQQIRPQANPIHAFRTQLRAYERACKSR